MHDLRDFHLSDMVRLDAGLRSGGQGAASMEAAARSVVTHLADRLIDKESGEKSCVLARLFVTVPLGSLEPALQEVARAALPPGLTGRAAESVRCLTLLATVGDESDWCSRRSSRGHQVVPLPNEAAIERSPMIAELFRQLGVDVGGGVAGDGAPFVVGRHGGAPDVFHVEHAPGSPFVPAQAEFVQRYGVRSVLGFGGVLPDGEVYAVICFSRSHIPRDTAEKFATVASSVGLVLLPHVGGRVFDGAAVRPARRDDAGERWRAEALGHLLEVHEASVLEQSLQLEKALGGLEDRALELHRTRQAIGRSEALKSAMLASALDAVVSIDAEGLVIEWNPAAEQIFGISRDDALGALMVDLIVPPRHRAAHRAGFARYLETGEPVILGHRIEIEAVRADGEELPIELTVSRAPTTGPPVFTAFLRDITEQRRATEHRQQLLVSERRAREAAERSARQVRRLYEVGAALSESVSSEDVGRTTLSVALREVGGSTGAVWRFDGKSDALRPTYSVGRSIGLLDLDSVPLTSDLPVAVACRDDSPVWVSSRAEGEARFPAWRAARSEARSFAVLPLRSEQKTFGSLVVGFAEERELSDEERTFLLSVAGQCAQALDRAQSRDREAAATARLAFLAEAGRTLGTSLDHSTTLQQITELSLTVLGDWCVVHLLDPVTRRFAQVAYTHKDPQRARLLDQLRDYQPPPGSPLDRAVSSLSTVNLPGLPDDVIRAGTNSPQEYELVKALSLGPTLTVPLLAHGSPIGGLTVGREAGDGPYDPETVALAEALAERAAAAIDNSRAHAARTEVAVTLQRSLMPLDLPTLPGLSLGFRYLPGTRDTEVGGDWFDVIPLSIGRSAVVIGDVMGRGVRAAAVMGQLRAAVRAYASLDLAPDALITELDRLVQGLGDGALVTCVYGVLDTLTGELTLCNAGHLPPLVTWEGGTYALELPSGAPLGVGGVDFETVDVSLPPDAALVLYTDGLVESRDRDVHAGIAELTGLLGPPHEDLDTLCDAVLRTMVGDAGHDDDAAILAVRRTTGRDGLTALRLLISDDLAAIGRARPVVEGALVRWGVPGAAETCVLLATELITNAVRHSGTTVELRVGLSGGLVAMEVHDDGPGTPQLRQPGRDDESGRGLVLLDRLSDRWGVRRSPRGGKSVWFEVPGRREG
ncbi:MAG TPA: SpoIIE family protein phosphatase [Actinomycetes bacterium]|nr:SpoIIE family protein phosphatase [Actinomycetes bacterium]